MRVYSARIDFQLAKHIATQWALRQHAFDRDFDRGFRLLGNQAFEVGRLDTAWETGQKLSISEVFEFLLA